MHATEFNLLQAKPLHALAKAAPADVWLRKQYPEAL